MLNENDIINRLQSYFKKNYKIKKFSKTNERGVDLIVENIDSGIQMLIEVKGETSSKPNSSRYGKPFSNSQVRTHIAEAVLTALKVVSNVENGNHVLAGIALPDTELHIRHIKKVRSALKKLKVKIFWVSKNGVREE